ncbi:MAG: hypothetical protein ACRDBG_22290 [Waterburya sp.]
MIEINAYDYIYSDHEDLLYRIALVLKQIETDHPPEANQRRIVEVLPDIQNQKIRISISLDASVELGSGYMTVAVEPRYSYFYPDSEN